MEFIFPLSLYYNTTKFKGSISPHHSLFWIIRFASSAFHGKGADSFFLLTRITKMIIRLSTFTALLLLLPVLFGSIAGGSDSTSRFLQHGGISSSFEFRDYGSGDGSETEYLFRKLVYSTSLKRTPERAPLLSVFDALELSSLCGVERPALPKRKPAGDFPRTFRIPSSNTVFYVDPVKGSDSAAGTLSFLFVRWGTQWMPHARHASQRQRRIAP